MSKAPSNLRRGLPFLILSAVLWGTVPVATGAIYRLVATNALTIGFLRLALSLLILLPIAPYVVEGGEWRLPRRDLAQLFLFGAAMALYQVCYFAAIPLVGVTVAALVTLCTAPLMVALLGVLLLGERLSGIVLLAMSLAIGGVVLLLDIDSFVATRSMLPGILLALGAALGFAIVALTSRALTGRYQSLRLITIGMGTGAMMLLPFALWGGIELSFPLPVWLLLLYLGVVPTALGYIVFFYGLRFTQAAVASVVNLVEPLTSTMLAWLFFDEKLSASAAVGAVLLLSAMAILYRGSNRMTQAL